MGEGGRELDLDIVSESWRALSDADAYEDMIAAWDRKLAAVKRQPKIPLLDGILKRQLASIDHLLSDDRTVKLEDPIEKAVSATPAPAMVLSPDGLVVAHNASATTYFGIQQGTRAGEGWVREDSLGDYRAIRSSGLGGRNADYAIIRTMRDDRTEALAEVFRLQIDSAERPYTVVRSLELDWYPKVSSDLAQVFGMTDAETDICRLLFAHRDLDVVAEKRGVALETVRNQVKRVLVKSELHSKTELIRLLALLCARAATEHEEGDLEWSDPFGNEAILIRRDGRKLAHSWVGAKDGRPVLFVHGVTSNFFLPEIARNALEGAGVKLICPSLPGFGNSDPPADSEQLADSCDALEELCDALSLSQIPAVASYVGQVYLTRLAQLRPDLLSMQLCIGLPWSLIQDRSESLPPTQRIFANLARDAPMAFDVLCRVSHHVTKKRGPEFFLSNAFGETEADRVSLADPELQPLLRVGFRHLAAQGHLAFRRMHEMSARHPMASWLGEVQVPMHWLVPEQVGRTEEEDLDRIRSLNPRISMERVPDTGELMAFQRPDLFVARLIELASDDPQQALSAHDPVVAGKCDAGKGVIA